MTETPGSGHPEMRRISEKTVRLHRQATTFADGEKYSALAAQPRFKAIAAATAVMVVMTSPSQFISMALDLDRMARGDDFLHYASNRGEATSFLGQLQEAQGDPESQREILASVLTRQTIAHELGVFDPAHPEITTENNLFKTSDQLAKDLIHHLHHETED